MPLEYDPTKALAHLKRKDKALAGVIKRYGAFNLETRDGIFRSLSRAIFFQQLAGPAARAIMGRTLTVVGATEDDWYEPKAFLKAKEEDLRGAGLSRQKLIYLQDLADKFASGELTEDGFHHLDDEEVIAKASSVKGIGRWTAEMLLMFSLGRPDVLPVDDLGVQKGMLITYGLDAMPKAAQMREIAEPWRPYRSVGSWYMWRALDVEVPEQGRGYKPPATGAK